MTRGRPPSSSIEQRRSHDAARSQARYVRAHAVIRSVRLDRRQSAALQRIQKTTGRSIVEVLRDAITAEAGRLRLLDADDPMQPRRTFGLIQQVLGNITLDEVQANDLHFIRQRTGENVSSLIRRLIEPR
jgi:hypothetical protein